MGQKEEQICHWGRIEKRCRICKWDGRGNNKPGYICNWGGIEKWCCICKWDRRKNKFVIGKGLKNRAGFVNGTEQQAWLYL